MKIACLVGIYPPLLYFARRVHERFGASLLVVEQGGSDAKPAAGLPRRLYWRWRKKGACRLVSDLVTRPAARKRESRLYPPGYRDDYERIFGDRFPALDASTPQLAVPSVNDPAVRERLLQLAPDVLLDHGTGLVKDHIIETARSSAGRLVTE